jgi:catechol 2,3-dioxygenase-like lactoylglutathione lyase family enzyme
MRFNIKKLDHINIVVSNLEEAKAFFLKFGFQVEDEATLQGEWISNVVGLNNAHARYIKLASPGSDTNLELIEYITPRSKDKDPLMSQANQIGFRHIAFEVNNIDEITEYLKSSGIQCFSDVQTIKTKGKSLVYFLGPDGIILELAQYFDKSS